jgi:outer membrane biogenesis lipoprotein LolB
MKKIFFSLMMAALLALTACASPTSVGTTQPSPSDQVATIVAATLQAPNRYAHHHYEAAR